MNKKRRAFPIFFLITICLGVADPGGLFAQRSRFVQTGLETVNNRVRIMALGEATVAMDGYTGAAHINPATIGWEGFLHFGSNFTPQSESFPDMRRNMFDNQYMLDEEIGYRSQKWALLAGVRYVEFANNFYSDLNNDDLNIQLVGSYALNPHLRLGVGLNYLKFDFKRFDSISMDGESFSVDMGMYYETRKNLNDNLVFRPSFGLSITDFGPKMKHEDLSYASALPMMLRGGVNMTLVSRKRYFDRPNFRVSLLLQWSKEMIGGKLNELDFDGPFKSLFSSWGAFSYNYGTGTDTVSPIEQIHRHQGIEASFREIFFVRAGHQKRKWNGSYAHDYSFGAGIDLYYVAFDYAYMDYDDRTYILDHGNYWEFTLRIPFGKHPENFWPKLLR